MNIKSFAIATLLVTLCSGLCSLSFGETVWTPALSSVSDWFDYADGGEGKRDSSSSKTTLLFKINAGKNQSVGFGFNWLPNAASKTLSGEGICLTYRAAHQFRLDLANQAVTDYDYFGYEVPATEDYTSLFIPYSDLAQEGWGKKLSWTLAGHKSVQFSYKGSYATKDSTNTVELLEIGIGDVCSTAEAPKSGTAKSVGLFWDATDTLPTTTLNSFGGTFTTYQTGSSAQDFSATEFLAAKQAIGFSATLKGTGYPIAGLNMTWGTKADTLADLTATEGLCVTYRSTSGARLQILQQGMEYNGNYFGYDLAASPNYTMKYIPFSELAQEKYWGYDAVLDLKRSNGLQFELKGQAGKTGDMEILQLGLGNSCAAPNFAPTLQAPYNPEDSAFLNEGETLSFALNKMFTDRDGDSLVFIVNANKDSLVISYSADKDTLFVTPVANLSGNTSLLISAKDKDLNLAVYTLRLTLKDTDNPPNATADNYQLLEDDTFVVTTAQGVLSNDYDVDENSFEIISNTEPTHGILTFNKADGSFTYVPNENYSGIDSFTYTIEDESTLQATGIVTLLVQEVNDLPTVSTNIINVLDTLEEDFGDALLAISAESIVFSDVETPADQFIYSVTTDGKLKASITKNSTNFVLALSSVANANGLANLTMWGKDAAGDSIGVPLQILLTPVADIPIAKRDTYVVLQDSVWNIAAKDGVLKNDSNPDGESTLTAHLATEPLHGKITLQGDGSLTYEPESRYVGNDSLTYVVVNALGDTSLPATIAFEIKKRNMGPEVVLAGARIDSVRSEDFSTRISYTKSVISSWFKDPDGDKLYFSVLNEDGKVSPSLTTGSYLHISSVRDSIGEAVVYLMATDSIPGTKPAVVEIHIEITPVNDAPKIAKRDTIQLDSGKFSLELDLDSVFYDPDGDLLKYEIVSIPVSLQYSLDGSILKVSSDDADSGSGLYRLKFKASDDSLTTNTTIILNVGGSLGIHSENGARPQISWKQAILQNSGELKVYDMRGRLLGIRTLPTCESEIYKMTKSVGGRAVLLIQKSSWILN